jgi:aminoglycoside 6'-N-acetyltransferase
LHHPVLREANLTLRPVTAADLPAILAVLSDPTVVRWWGPYDEEKVVDEFGPEQEEEAVFMIEVEGAVAGIIQFGEELDPDYKHASMDIALAEAFQGKGVGRRAIGLVARYLFEERGHHRLIIDPAEANANAISAYRRVGFRPVGVMRQYESFGGGEWHDNLLMDMLRPDFEAAD